MESLGPIWSALLPALVIMTYFGVGLIIYTLRYFIRGSYHDQEIEKRKVSFLIGKWFVQFFAWVVRPFWLAVRKSNVPPNVITTVSMLFALAAAVSIGVGRFALGGWLYLFAGICDNFDGRLARERGEAGPRGAALDSVMDRYSEGAVLIGFAWYYRETWVLLAVLIAMVGTFLIPYIRAKGEVLKINMEVGLMQRAERVLYLGLTAALSPVLEALIMPSSPKPFHFPVVIALVFLAVGTQVTAFSRFLYLLGNLGTKQPSRIVQPKAPSRTRNVAAETLALGVDFLLVVALVAGTSLPPWVATIVGCMLGALLNASVHRVWALGNGEPVLVKVLRYGFLGLSSALLNGGGMALMSLMPAVDYRIAWVLVRVFVYTAWSLPLLKEYFFTPEGVRALQPGSQS